MGWLQRLLVSRFVKGLLDKIPGNGFKTAIGILLIALGALASAKPEYSPIINWLIDLLSPYASLISDSGIISLITGVVHKLAKWVDGRSAK